MAIAGRILGTIELPVVSCERVRSAKSEQIYLEWTKQGLVMFFGPTISTSRLLRLEVSVKSECHDSPEMKILLFPLEKAKQFIVSNSP